MKQNQKRLIKLLTLLLIIVLIIILKTEMPNLIPKKSTKAFPQLQKDQIKVLSFSKDKSTTIYKKNNYWYLKNNNAELRADTQRIEKIIAGIIDLQKDNLVSTNKNKHLDLGINQQKIEVKTDSKNYIIYVGNSSGSEENYVRIANEDEVFLAKGLSEAFASDDYRDLSLHIVENEDRVTYILLNSEGNEVVLSKKNNDWKIGDKTAKKDRVDFFINDLKTLKANDILAKNTKSPEVAPVVIKIKESEKDKLIEFYPQDENNYLAKTSMSDFIFQIPTAYVASLKKEEEDFLE